MNLSARMILVLTLVGLISGSLLAVVGMLTKDRIEFNRKQEINAAILVVVPGTASSEILFEEENYTVYGGKDDQGNLIGYAVYTSGTGFQDVIRLIFGTNPDLTLINSLYILEQKETPGLGAKITDRDAFLQFWENRDATSALILKKPAVSSPADLQPSEVNAITGATISSEKVMGIVNQGLNKLKTAKQEGKLAGEGNDVD